MDFFELNKYQSIEENILYTSKLLYELLKSKKHVDVLFTEFAYNQKLILNINIERILYLALTLLYSLGIISIKNNMVMRVSK
jgi:hypothetical protein